MALDAQWLTSPLPIPDGWRVIYYEAPPSAYEDTLKGTHHGT